MLDIYVTIYTHLPFRSALNNPMCGVNSSLPLPTYLFVTVSGTFGRLKQPLSLGTIRSEPTEAIAGLLESDMSSKKKLTIKKIFRKM
jgi:hypothetical protein